MSSHHELESISIAPAANCLSPEMHESYMDADGTAASVDGKKRSSFRIFAIMTALFVCFDSLFSPPPAYSHIPQLSLFIAALDATIVATAIPTIAAQLHSASGYTW